MKTQQTLTQNYKGLIPAAEKTGELRSDHTFDVENDTNTIASEPAPNKAQPQHSPLPWVVTETAVAIITEPPNSKRICTLNTDRNLFPLRERLANAKLIVASVNHADKLAEALKCAETVLAERGVELKEITRALENWKATQ